MAEILKAWRGISGNTGRIFYHLWIFHRENKTSGSKNWRTGIWWGIWGKSKEAVLSDWRKNAHSIINGGWSRRFWAICKTRKIHGIFGTCTKLKETSDEKQKRYNITKAGNSHLRRLLVEAAQAYTRGNIGQKSEALKQRQQGNPHQVIAYADKANERQRRRFYKMTLNKKLNSNIAITAIAREQACFMWGLMTGHIGWWIWYLADVVKGTKAPPLAAGPW